MSAFILSVVEIRRGLPVGSRKKINAHKNEPIKYVVSRLELRGVSTPMFVYFTSILFILFYGLTHRRLFECFNFNDHYDLINFSVKLHFSVFIAASKKFGKTLSILR